MAEILVRIGAAIDPSLPNAFRPLLDGAERANEALGRASRRRGQTTKSDADRAAKEEERAIKKRLDYERKQRDQHFQNLNRDEQKALRERERLQAQSVARAARQAESQRNREANRQRRHNEIFGRDFSNRVGTNVGGVARAAAGLGGSALRGTGFDTNVEGMFGRGVELERLAVSLSNQGVNTQQGKGRIDPNLIAGKIRGAADLTAMSRTDIGGGIGEFVTRTGDLQAGLGMLDELAKLAKVADANFVDMGGAAGEVANALGDMPADKKAAEIVKLMNAFAAMGKMGAVELKDMATGFGKVGAASTAFEGNGSDNLRMMGAFLQLARAKGGAASARESATAIAGMANTLKTPARIGRFKEEGIEVINPETGMIRDPSKIIMDALAKTQGDPERMKKMFANVIGAKPAEAMATTFRTARADALGRGASQDSATQQGLAAVKAELDKFKNATIDAAEFADSFGAAMNTTASKAQLAQNRFDDIAARVMERVLPALERLEPGVTKAAEAFTGIVAWAAENPGQAITAAIVGSIAKAGIEASVSSLISQGLGKLSGSAAGAAAGLALVGAAAVAGYAALKNYFDAKDEAETKDSAAQTDREVMVERAVRGREKLARGQAVTEEERKAMAEAPRLQAQLEQDVALGTGDQRTGFAKGLWNDLTGSGPGWDYNERVSQAQDNLGQNKAMLAVLQGLAPDIATAVKQGMGSVQINVTVNNPQGVNEGARSDGSVSSPGVRRGEL